VKTIIVPLDGSEHSERAIDVACRLAGRSGAAVHLMTVAWKGLSVPLEEADADAARYLEDRARCTDAAEVGYGVEHGRPAEAIVRAATRAEDAVVCLSTHGRGVAGRALLGSVADEVVQHSPVPVVLIGPNADPTQGEGSSEMVVCSDGSTTAHAVAEPAAAIAERLGLSITVVEVAKPEGPLARFGSRDDDAGTPGEGLAELADVLRRHGAPSVEVDVVRGSDPAETIADCTAKRGAALVAMATHGRGGFGRVVLGSVAMRTVRLSPAPVVVVSDTATRAG
jgi:nucleotide-binding universal stress UspA family protein